MYVDVTEIGADCFVYANLHECARIYPDVPNLTRRFVTRDLSPVDVLFRAGVQGADYVLFSCSKTSDLLTGRRGIFERSERSEIPRKYAPFFERVSAL